MIASTLLVTYLWAVASAHEDLETQKSMSGPHQALWYNALPGDEGTQVMPPLVEIDSQTLA